SQFLQVLEALDDAWRTRRADLDTNAERLTTAIAATTELAPADDIPGLDAVNAALEAISRAIDPEWGGFGRGPKFPNTHHLEVILRAHIASGGAGDAERVLTTTLDTMAAGGIYDHLGGGFARYAVDREWLVPHF